MNTRKFFPKTMMVFRDERKFSARKFNKDSNNPVTFQKMGVSEGGEAKWLLRLGKNLKWKYRVDTPSWWGALSFILLQ